jgi:hypothetical protein
VVGRTLCWPELSAGGPAGASLCGLALRPRSSCAGGPARAGRVARFARGAQSGLAEVATDVMTGASGSTDEEGSGLPQIHA